MADVNISKFRASVVRDGSKPASPGFVVSEGQDPVNPPGTNNFVPYTGATANVELGEFGLEAGFITLDTTPTNTPTDQGTIFWDSDDETVDIVLNGYTMKIGEDLFYPVKNQTGSTIAKGVAVRFNGTVGASGRLLIAPFIADGSVLSSRFMGVTAEEILNGEDGKVLYFGRVRGIDTNAFNEGDILYASTTVAGGYQTAIPVAPNNIVLVAAVVTKSINQGTIFVRPVLASNLNTDEAVKLTSVADKNLLQYQSGTSLWENKSLAQVLGGTSSQFVKGDASLDSTSYQPLLTNPVTGTGTSGTIPIFTGSTTIGNSIIQANSTEVNIVGNGSALLFDSLGSTKNGGIGYINDFVLNVYNSRGTGSTIELGNTNLNLITDSTTRLTINNIGNVLIGSPPAADNGARLQVSGTATVSDTVTYSSANNRNVTGTSGATTGYIYSNFTNSGNSLYWGLENSAGNGIGWTGGPLAYSAFFGSTDNRAVHIMSNSAVRLTVAGGGNVLIGTTTDNGSVLRVSGTGGLQVDGFQRIVTYTLTVSPSTTGTITITSPTGTNMQGSMMVLAGGYGNSVSGNITGQWMVGGLLFFNNAGTSTITTVVNSVSANGSMSFQRSGADYTVTLTNTSATQNKSLRVSVIINAST